MYWRHLRSGLPSDREESKKEDNKIISMTIYFFVLLESFKTNDLYLNVLHKLQRSATHTRKYLALYHYSNFVKSWEKIETVKQ